MCGNGVTSVVVFTIDRDNHEAEFACVPKFKLTRLVVQTSLHVVTPHFVKRNVSWSSPFSKSFVFQKRANVCKGYEQIKCYYVVKHRLKMFS